MKNKIQTILLMVMALATMGSVVSSDKSQLIQSGSDIFKPIENTKKTYSFLIEGLSNFVDLETSKDALSAQKKGQNMFQLLKDRTFVVSTDLENMDADYYQQKMIHMSNFIATSTVLILSMKNPELAASLQSDPNNKQWTKIYNKFDIEGFGNFNWKDTVSQKYLKSDGTDDVDEVKFENSLLFKILQQLKASDKIKTAMTAIMAPVPNIKDTNTHSMGSYDPSRPFPPVRLLKKDRLTYLGKQNISSEACALAFGENAKIIFDGWGLTKLQTKKENGDINISKYTKDGIEYTVDQEELTLGKAQYLKIQDDKKEMGKALGTIITTQTDLNQLMEGINGSNKKLNVNGSKDSEEKKNDTMAEKFNKNALPASIGAGTSLLATLLGTKTYKHYTKKQQKMDATNNEIQTINNQNEYNFIGVN